MKRIAIVLFGIMAISLSVQAGPRVVLTEDQAQTIAVMHVRALNVKDDVLSVVHDGIEPVYSIASILHLGYDVYQISVRSMRPGQTCQQSIVIDDASGALDAKQVAECE